MRNLFRILVFVMAGLLGYAPIYGQEISFKNEDGASVAIGTTPVVINNVHSSNKAAEDFLSIALHCLKNNKINKETYLFVVGLKPFQSTYSRHYYTFSFDRGSHLLILTSKGTIVSLQHVDNIEDVDCYEHNEGFLKNPKWVVSPKYNLPKQVIDTLLSEGISRFRFDSTWGIIDFEIVDNQICTVLKKEYDLLRSTIDFRSGF